MADPDLQIKGVGAGLPDPEIREGGGGGGGGGAVSKKNPVDLLFL